MRLIIIESPYAADDAATALRNSEYAREAIADCLRRGEAPFASHILYAETGVLDDGDPEQRSLGIEAGLAWGRAAAATAAYVDHGVSPGMRQGILAAEALGRPVEIRFLYPQDEIAHGSAT